MAIQYNENIKIAAPAPLDKRYLSTRTSFGAQVPYSACTEVNSTIISSERYTGLTVNIGGVEYWYKTGVLDSCLIEKKYDTNIPQYEYTTGATNLGFFSGCTGVQCLQILGTGGGGCDGTYYSEYNNYYIDSTSTLRIGEYPHKGALRRAYVNAPRTVSWVYNVPTSTWVLTPNDAVVSVGCSVGCIFTSVFPNVTWGSYVNSGATTVCGYGSLTTGGTCIYGAPVYACTECQDVHIRTLVSCTPTNIRLGYDENFIYFSGTSAILTGENIGVGSEVFKQKTGTTLQFRTLIGSGGTTVNTVGDTIVITASGGTGGGTYNLSSPAVCTVGGITAGTVLTGKTAFELFEEILVPAINPSFIAPYVTTSLSDSLSPVEVGTTYYGFDVCSSYNAGSITPVYPPTASSCRSCGVIGYCFTSTEGSVDGYYVDGATLRVESIATLQVAAGLQSWTTCACHCAGVQPYDSKGCTYCSSLAAGFTTTSTVSICGMYPWFWGKTASAPTIDQSLINGYCGKCLADGSGTIVVPNYNAVCEYIWFAVPATATVKTIWQGCNNPSNNGVIPDSFMATGCVISISSPDSCPWTSSYRIYVSNYATSINYGMAFCN